MFNFNHHTFSFSLFTAIFSEIFCFPPKRSYVSCSTRPASVPFCPPFPIPINSLYCHFSSTLTNSGSSRWKSIIAAPAQIIKCWPSLLSLCFVAVIDNVFLFGECVYTSTMFIFGRSNDELGLVKETFFRFAGDWIRTCDFISLSAAEDFFKELAFLGNLHSYQSVQIIVQKSTIFLLFLINLTFETFDGGRLEGKNWDSAERREEFSEKILLIFRRHQPKE